MTLNKEDLEKIKHTDNATLLNLSIGRYFSKLAYSDYSSWYATSELIGSLIGRDLGFVTPLVKIINIDANRWIISEDLNNYGSFSLAQDLGIDAIKNNSLFSILETLKKVFLNEPNLDELFKDIIKLYLFDIFLCNGDRCCVNWGIVKTKECLKVAIFDNEALLNDSVIYDISSSLDGSTWLEDVTSNSKEVRIKKMTEDLTRFLTIPDNPYLEVFSWFLNFMTPDYFAHILDVIENEEKITTLEGEKHFVILDKEAYLNMYRENYDLINGIYQNLKMTR